MPPSSPKPTDIQFWHTGDPRTMSRMDVRTSLWRLASAAPGFGIGQTADESMRPIAEAYTQIYKHLQDPSLLSLIDEQFLLTIEGVRAARFLAQDPSTPKMARLLRRLVQSGRSTELVADTLANRYQALWTILASRTSPGAWDYAAETLRHSKSENRWHTSALASYMLRYTTGPALAQALTHLLGASHQEQSQIAMVLKALGWQVTQHITKDVFRAITPARGRTIDLSAIATFLASSPAPDRAEIFALLRAWKSPRAVPATPAPVAR